MIKIQFEKLIKRIRSDLGGDYIPENLESFLRARGIVHQFSKSQTPEHNAVAERFNKTLVVMSRFMLNHSSLPINFWEESIWTSSYIRNMCSTKLSIMKLHF